MSVIHKLRGLLRDLYYLVRTWDILLRRWHYRRASKHPYFYTGRYQDKLPNVKPRPIKIIGQGNEEDKENMEGGC